MVSLSKDKDKWEMIFTFVNSVVIFSKNKYRLVMNTARLYSFHVFIVCVHLHISNHKKFSCIELSA